MSSAPAILRPSGAPRWVPCPGSVSMEARFPETEESQPAREGTAAHWAASESLLGGTHPAVLIGQAAPNGVIITEEMVRAAAHYVQDVLRVVGDAVIQVENPVEISCIHPDNAGTPDNYSRIGDTLHVWDFKYGWGRVDAFENWQVIDYAAGILDDLLPREGLPEEVEFRIVQPRPYCSQGPVKIWRVSVSLLNSKYFPILRESAKAATSEGSECTPGGHCANCKAAHACPALNASVLRVMDLCELALPDELSGAALGAQIELLQLAETLVKTRKAGIEAQALAEIKQGGGVPGWTAAEGRTNRKWAAVPEEVIAFGHMVGVDLSKPGVKSPAQAEKAGLSKELVACYTTSPPGALKLVKQDTSVFNRIPEGVQ